MTALKELTDQEKEVLNHLVKAHKAFIALESQHPDELKDWVDGIHRLQMMVGFRSAQRTNPDIIPPKFDHQS